MKTITHHVKFAASPHDLYELYMDAKKHGAIQDARVTISRKAGSKMTAWDGYCWGTILHLVPDRLIVQTWRTDEWTKDEPDSILLLRFDDSTKGAELTMVHTNLPDRLAAQFDKGWKDHYWTSWKEFVANK